MTTHICHAMGCNTPVPPRLWGCRRHWYMLPNSIRRKIWAHYRPGQEIDKKPTVEYLYWSFRAQLFVADLEGHTGHHYDYAHDFVTTYEQRIKSCDADFAEADNDNQTKAHAYNAPPPSKP